MKKTSLLLIAFVATSCSLPWNITPDERELNVGFKYQSNEIRLASVTIAGREGNFLLATAHPRTIVDPGFVKRERIDMRNVSLRLGHRQRVRVRPALLPLDRLADATIGADAFEHEAITIDYAKEMLIVRHVADLTDMAAYSFAGVPNVPVTLNGVPERAVVDTLVPDTLIVPSRLAGRHEGRMNVSLSVGGVTFPSVDARVADVDDIRLGNRILSKFLVTVDYSRNVIGLWRDPRAAAATPTSDGLR